MFLLDHKDTQMGVIEWNIFTFSVPFGKGILSWGLDT